MSKGYTYMAAVDSGVSMDYSPMRRVDDIHNNEYKNGIEAHRKAFLVKKHPVYGDGWDRIKERDGLHIDWALKQVESHAASKETDAKV